GPSARDLVASFRSQIINWVCYSGFKSLRTHRKNSNEYGDHPGRQKYFPVNADAISKIPQPFVHKVPTYRKGDQHGNKNQLHEILGQHIYDIANRSTEDFTNADLFRALLGGICNQPK